MLSLRIIARSALALGVLLNVGYAAPKKGAKAAKDDLPPLVHPLIGETVSSSDGAVTVTLYGKKQNFYGGDPRTRDTDINSPKSVNIHPNGQKYYVNSLEGGTTIVYNMADNGKIKVIKHKFNDSNADLWGEPSEFFKFTYQYPKKITPSVNTFMGKPVESTFSHNGKYLWIPYYRRSFDMNAQDPSAVAIIDTDTDEIIRLITTGPLPKMVATSPDNKYVAITHWGNNTVGLINIEAENPMDWKFVNNIVIDYELPLNFNRNKKVDRDSECGYCLRGTVFTPDGKYLFVGCMGGGGGMAVIDMEKREYLGRVMGMYSNMRHLVIKNDYLYLSINKAGVVQRIPLQKIYDAIGEMKNKKTTVTGWENAQVGSGARTIELSPDGRYVFAACNRESALYVVDTEKMKVVTHIAVDSYPVGLDISKDGRFVFVTSQGRSNQGGNAVNIYEIKYGQQEQEQQ
jgi:YVTN family beta-propeller protein